MNRLKISQIEMKKTIKYTCYITLMLVIAEVRSYGQLSPEQIEILRQSDNKAISLFNSHNLEGWYTFLQDRGRDNDPKSVFAVADGMIRISGEEWGCITTNAEYENYRIIA